MNNNDDIRRTSLRIDESLAVGSGQIRQITTVGRSTIRFLNSSRRASPWQRPRRRFSTNANPINLLKVAASCDEDASPKHREAP